MIIIEIEDFDVILRKDIPIKHNAIIKYYHQTVAKKKFIFKRRPLLKDDYRCNARTMNSYKGSLAFALDKTKRK